jgi:hypothetical protein
MHHWSMDAVPRLITRGEWRHYERVKKMSKRFHHIFFYVESAEEAGDERWISRPVAIWPRTTISSNER